MKEVEAVILNEGGAAWAFEEHAERLSRVMNVGIASTPAKYNYVLGWDHPNQPAGQSFIPYPSILGASDKRRMASAFEQHGVAIPRTFLPNSAEEVKQLVESDPGIQWVLKWPTGCGGSGHRLQAPGSPVPMDWPTPYLLQEFIALDTPEVYRLYCVAGETFGWNVRRFPPGAKTSPFVAHARGARYEEVGPVPAEAEHQAKLALSAAGLIDSFGCADLIQAQSGRWLVLEVNTDGVFNIVDRDITIGGIAQEIDRRLARAFWSFAGMAQ